jgi:hypothetical protein
MANDKRWMIRSELLDSKPPTFGVCLSTGSAVKVDESHYKDGVLQDKVSVNDLHISIYRRPSKRSKQHHVPPGIRTRLNNPPFQKPESTNTSKGNGKHNLVKSRAECTLQNSYGKANELPMVFHYKLGHW